LEYRLHSTFQHKMKTKNSDHWSFARRHILQKQITGNFCLETAFYFKKISMYLLKILATYSLILLLGYLPQLFVQFLGFIREL
jgi:hypothetical protein